MPMTMVEGRGQGEQGAMGLTVEARDIGGGGFYDLWGGLVLRDVGLGLGILDSLSAC